MYWTKLVEYLDRGGVPEERGILKAKVIADHKLEIWFEEDHNVSIYELDFLPILTGADVGAALKPLLDSSHFSQVVGNYNLTWNDPETGEYNSRAIDIAPEAVRWLCRTYGTVIKSE